MKTIRINMEVPEEYRDRLKALQSATGSTSQAEALRKAIGALEEITKIKASGGTLNATYPEGKTSTLIFL